MNKFRERNLYYQNLHRTPVRNHNFEPMAYPQEDYMEMEPHSSNTPNPKYQQQQNPQEAIANQPHHRPRENSPRREPKEWNPDFGFDNSRPNKAISAHRKFARQLYVLGAANQEQHANKIVAKMEREDALMEDTPLSEQLRREALRDLPQCLTTKRNVKQKLFKSVSQKSKRKPIGLIKRFQYKISINWKHFKTNIGHINYFNLWHSTLKDIEGHFGSGYASYFKFLRWIFVMNFMVTVMLFVVVALPQLLFNVTKRRGFFEDTILYYGHYTPGSFSLIPGASFHMPAAYFSTIVVIYLISFIVLASSIFQYYRRTFIETQGGLQNVFASKVLCGWDFGIATRPAAELRSSAIYNELKELLSEEDDDFWDRSCLDKLWTYTIQAIIHFLFVLLLGGITWGTWLLLHEYELESNEIYVLSSVIVSIIMSVSPVVFHYIAKYEDYKEPKTRLYITLIRTYLLGFVIIGAILSFWLTKASEDSPELNCWENSVGFQMYRLIVFDFICYVLLNTIFEVVYSLILKCNSVNYKYEFNIARHTLQIIYNQGLFWVGCLYSPLLSLLVTIKLLIIWYVRKICVRHLCTPPKRTWRAAQAQTWFMMMIFLSILVVIAVHGYTLKSVPTSKCGPLQGYHYMYEIVSQSFADLQKTEFWKVVLYITRPGAIALIIVALCIFIFYSREQAKAEKERVKLLREMLVWSAKDKKFLIQWYSKVTNGGYIQNVRDSRFMDPRLLLPQDYKNNDLDGDSSSFVTDTDFSSRLNQFF